MEDLIKVKANFTWKDFYITSHEILMINKLCLKCVEDIFVRNDINFDHIEKINNEFQNYKWGSNKDRAYRKRSIKKAIHNFGLYTTNYITLL